MITYENEASSSALDVKATEAGTSIISMIESIDLFYANGWGIMTGTPGITVTNGAGTVCNAGSSTTITISIPSKYGNLPSLGVIGYIITYGDWYISLTF